MAKITNFEKAKYRRVLQEGQEEEDNVCFFCAKPALMDDLTPNGAATQKDKDEFPDEWVRVKTCDQCWRKIYTANIALAGMKFAAKKGCMTLEQKVLLLAQKQTAIRAKSAHPESEQAFGISEDQDIILPAEAAIIGATIHVGKDSFTHVEMTILQGPLCLAYCGRPAIHIQASFDSVKSFLDPAKEPLYRAMLGLLPKDAGW